MPALPEQKHAPSTLADVIGQVIDAFDAMGEYPPDFIMVGDQYLDSFGEGSAPRVLFLPEVGGKWGPPLEMGNAASVTHSCEVLIRGPEAGATEAKDMGGDNERFRATYELMDKVIGCLVACTAGRIEGGSFVNDSPTKADAFGADVSLKFTYKRDVPHLSKRWALTPPAADTSAARPAIPPGGPGTATSIGITVSPKDPTDP